MMGFLALWPLAAALLPALAPEGGSLVVEESFSGAVSMPETAWSPDWHPVERSGQVHRRVWQTPGATSPVALLDALIGDDLTPVFTCTDRACGGYDFRFALDLLPPPEMFVDLSDFAYWVGRADDAHVAVVTSRDETSGFVHLTVVTPGNAQPPAAEVTEVQPPVLPVAPTVPGQASTLFAADGRTPLDDVVFEPGSASLADTDSADLAALALYLTQNPASRVAIVGHTDATGSLAANIALSERRARAVVDRLVTRHGVARERIEAAGAGYLSPRAPNLTEDGRARNRRVEAVLLDTE